jgi:hypothetical protein
MKISGRWFLVGFYIIGIIAFTPYLPQIIRMASSRWTSSSVSHFVFKVEILIALLILAVTLGFLISRRSKSPYFLLGIEGIFLISFIAYKYLPNPYEFTHLPEYAILSMLMARAMDERETRGIETDRDTTINRIKKEDKKIRIVKNIYFQSGMLTGLIGIGDEIYQHFLPNRFFTLYDIFLNILGGILGLLIFLGIKK